MKGPLPPVFIGLIGMNSRTTAQSNKEMDPASANVLEEVAGLCAWRNHRPFGIVVAP